MKKKRANSAHAQRSLSRDVAIRNIGGLAKSLEHAGSEFGAIEKIDAVNEEELIERVYHARNLLGRCRRELKVLANTLPNRATIRLPKSPATDQRSQPRKNFPTGAGMLPPQGQTRKPGSHSS